MHLKISRLELIGRAFGCSFVRSLLSEVNTPSYPDLLLQSQPDLVPLYDCVQMTMTMMMITTTAIKMAHILTFFHQYFLLSFAALVSN